MKWLLIGVVLCLASLSDQSALKCVPGTKGVPCPEITEQRIGSDSEDANLPDGKNCAIGSHWKNRCNDCSCPADGNPSCTEKACPGQENELDSKCAPGSVWKDDCNDCWCVDGRPLCTRLGCTSMIITDFNPSRNDEEKDKKDSNKDNKNAEKIFFPSRIGGSENETKAIVCPAKRMFVKDCNTCWCNEDGTSYVCTRKVCVDNMEDVGEVEKQQPAKLKCKPDEVFVLDCNTCHCNSEGTAYSCTRRACPLIPIAEKDARKMDHSRKARAAQQETTKNCQPGQEFRMDCNKCLCDNEGQNYSCTRIDCTAISNNNGGTRTRREISSPMKAECVPGSEFRQRCNTCRCTADGVHATCTAKRCKDDVDVIEPDSKASFRCNPGEQFKRGCNDCTCSADGKDVFCTLRLCEQDITNI